MQTRKRKIITLVVLQTLVLQTLAPAGVALALTSGPAQPEFSSFEPVSTSSMVNPLTGEFTYNLPVLNVPGPEGAGYALSLSYHAGASPEEEASWVGYGWTLNPGAISRMKRGLPDDYNGDKVRYWNKTLPNWTVSANLKANQEAFSRQTPGATASIRYNNYRGFGYVAGLSTSVKGLASLGLTVGSDGLGFTYSVNPAAILSEAEREFQNNNSTDVTASTLHYIAHGLLDPSAASAWHYTQYSVSNEMRTTTFSPYTGISVNATIEGHFPPGPLPVGPNVGLTGNYTVQSPADYGLRSIKSYGYMYSANASAEDAMDYYVEKDAPYTKRDQFLAVPFSNADFYSVSGEGISGGFRLYNKKPGQFHPNRVHSETHIGNIEGQGRVGLTIVGSGAGFGIGRQTLDVDSWLDPTSLYGFAGDADGDEPYFFRMNNDLGGSVLFADDDAATSAALNSATAVPGFKKFDVGIGDDAWLMNHGKRSKRSTHIGYSTVDEILNSPTLTNTLYPNFQGYDASGSAGGSAGSAVRGTNSETERSRVSEFSMVNPSGSRYTYGLPVYSRKEKNLAYGLSELDVLDEQDRYLVYAHATATTSKIVVGEERDGAYPSTYLLTSITSPDYIDRSMDGPSPDDFGGYTKFNYARTAGDGVDYATLNATPPSSDPYQHPSRVRRTSSLQLIDETKWADPAQSDANQWYKWRVPYTGLQEQKGSLSDAKDDMGTMTMGEKEIYYLSTIETKTHVAVFVTNGGAYVHGRFFPGSGVHRKDGYEAAHNEYDITGNASATAAVDEHDDQRANQLRRLERIELWSKNADGSLKELSQTVHFEYDNSICPGLPNSFDDPGKPNDNGKLTLKRVYFEYNGVVNAKVNPYVFGYAYRTSNAGDYANLPSEVKTKYQSIIDYGNPWNAGEQNPAYEHYHLGRWGYYEYDGQARHEKMNPWEDQNPDMAQFDPAAWQLKWIRLPSGGEIHVQYEQNDYSYVQDRAAMAMVPMSSGDISAGRYYLDLQGSLGITPGSAEEDNLVGAMHDLFVDKREKLSFKVLHSLDFTAADITNIDKGRMEYVTGYVRITGVGRQVVGGVNRVYLQMANTDEYNTPTDVARVFTKAWRAHNFPGMEMTDGGDATANIKSLINRVGEAFSVDLPWTDDNLIDWPNSYVRIPLGKPDGLIRAKKGGGIRVARLLMYDPGLESGNGHLFGSEYIYKDKNGSSSGVATNEPADGRQENSLVRLLDRRVDQYWLERVISGRDKEQFEGPIGESILPAPTVMYGRVVVRNIHSGKTNAGFSIYEYNTSRDYPSSCIYDHRDVVNSKVTDIDRRSDFVVVPTPYFSYAKANIWATQGYRFILSDLPGRIKRVATYGGNYAAPNDEWAESSHQEYTYFQPGEKVPMLYEYSTEPTYVDEDPGREMEMTFEGRAVEDITIDASGSIDASISFVPPPAYGPSIPIVSMDGRVDYNESKLRTHVSCKVVRYPAIVKSVDAKQDGITSRTENIGFNPLTGDPCVTRMTDGYSGQVLQYANGVLGGSSSTTTHNRSYKSFSYPAAQEYKAMGQKSDNERMMIISDAALSIDKRQTGGDDYLNFRFAEAGKACNLRDILSPGDLIDVFVATVDGGYDPNRQIGVYHIGSIDGNRVFLMRHSASGSIGFMNNVSIRVLRSGKTNQLGVPRAGITVYSPD